MLQAQARRDRHVMAAFRAHVEVALHLRPIQHRGATVALLPQAFRHLALVAAAFGADARRHQLGQPAHGVPRGASGYGGLDGIGGRKSGTAG